MIRESKKLKIKTPRKKRFISFCILVLISVVLVTIFSLIGHGCDKALNAPQAVMSEEGGKILYFEVTSTNGKIITIYPSNPKFEELKNGTYDYYYPETPEMKAKRETEKDRELLKEALKKKE
jgi:hypothetical protein